MTGFFKALCLSRTNLEKLFLLVLKHCGRENSPKRALRRQGDRYWDTGDQRDERVMGGQIHTCGQQEPRRRGADEVSALQLRPSLSGGTGEPNPLPIQLGGHVLRAVVSKQGDMPQGVGKVNH